MNRLRNEFAFDSNFEMKQLCSWNFPDSSQACSFSVHSCKRNWSSSDKTYNLYRSKSQDGDF